MSAPRPHTASALRWVAFAEQPITYAHASWQQGLSDAWRRALRHAPLAVQCQALACEALPPFTDDDAARPGAGVALLADAELDELLTALALRSAGRLPDNPAHATRRGPQMLAARLQDIDLPWRAFQARSADVSEQLTLAREQLQLRLAHAAHALGAAWALRLRLRLQRLPSATLRRAPGMDQPRPIDAGWWARLEEALRPHLRERAHQP